jgi:anti-sigma factor RsiW
MSCSPFELKDYFLDELGPAERRQVEDHLQDCPVCREELERLGLTRSALDALRDEEPPRRIAFVSDKVFQPGWWQRFWQSAPRLGFAAAAMLSVAILVHAFLRPAPTAAPVAADTAAIEARISAAVAASEARQARQTAQLVADVEKRLDFDRRADRVAFEEAFSVLQKRYNVMFMASAELGVRK